MNIPFRFAAASADDILQLNDVAANLILANLLALGLTDTQVQRFALFPPLNPGWLVGLSIQANKDATVEFGVYDSRGAKFAGVCPVQLLAAGTSAYHDRFSTGLYLPLGGVVVPAIKVIVGTTVILSGQIETIPDFANSDTPFNPGGQALGLLGLTQ